MSMTAPSVIGYKTCERIVDGVLQTERAKCMYVSSCVPVPSTFLTESESSPERASVNTVWATRAEGVVRDNHPAQTTGRRQRAAWVEVTRRSVIGQQHNASSNSRPSNSLTNAQIPSFRRR